MSHPQRLRAMRDAIYAGNLKKVRLLLKAGVPATGQVDSRTFVQEAAGTGNLEAYELLVEAGAVPELPEVLFVCAQSPHPTAETVRKLLEHPISKSDLDAACRQAALHDNDAVVAVLVEHGAENPVVPDTDEEPRIAALRDKLAPAARTAWLPEVVVGEDDPRGSKFAGVPRLDAAAEWPRCGYCDQPLQLFLQVDLASSPLAEICGDGTLQVFYCRQPDTYCEEVGDDLFSPFGRFVLARIHHVSEDRQVGDDLATAPLTPSRITGWRPLDDHPTPDEPPEVTGITLTDEEAAILEDDGPLHFTGDKLLGWPTWVQAYEPIGCPDCGKPMRFLLQLASRGHLDHGFGDCGIARLVQCAEHPERLGFAWAGS